MSVLTGAIRVLVVDDSSLVRAQLQRDLGRFEDLEVVGAAPDPYVALGMIKERAPQVLILDIEMPRMDGLTFLRKLMQFHPIPTIILSSLTTRGCSTAMACLEAGAFEVLSKPGTSYSVGELADDLAHLIRGAARVRARPRAPRPTPRAVQVAAPNRAMIETTRKIVAIGGSTGGTEALREVLMAMPPHSPGIVCVLHMPENFTKSYAERLDSLCAIQVKEAEDNDSVRPGLALIAPGNHHLQLRRSGAQYIVRVADGPRVLRHRPSVEVLFSSVAKYAGANAIGIMLTGMGDDGGGGMKAMADAGAHTIAQDEKTCIVFGMPKVAIDRGGVKEILPLDAIAKRTMEKAV